MFTIFIQFLAQFVRVSFTPPLSLPHDAARDYQPAIRTLRLCLFLLLTLVTGVIFFPHTFFRAHPVDG